MLIMTASYPTEYVTIKYKILCSKKLRILNYFSVFSYLFWSEWDTNDNYAKSSISRSYMDGTNTIRLIYQDIYWPNALTVDHVLKLLFYADAKKGEIGLTDLGMFLKFFANGEINKNQN